MTTGAPAVPPLLCPEGSASLSCHLLRMQEVVIDKPQSGSLSKTSTLILNQPNLFTPGTFVTITNT